MKLVIKKHSRKTKRTLIEMYMLADSATEEKVAVGLLASKEWL